MRSRLFFLSLLTTAGAFAQSFQLEFGGANLQDAVATVSDATGHTTLVRETFPQGDKMRIRILRTTLQGQNQQWYDVAIPGACFVQAAVPSGDGNITLCGSRIAPGRSDQDALIAKVSPTGEVLWSWTSNTPSLQEQLIDVRRTDDGGYIACGSRRDTADSDALLVRLDPSGNLQWQQRYGTTAEETANSVALDGNGYMAAGRITGFDNNVDATSCAPTMRAQNSGGKAGAA
ncbi:MAG: hypothetical protein IPI95_05295 [Flavobacteriales bacterium]|nr:hypothetical protein [Flavobacteriales bacterium]